MEKDKYIKTGIQIAEFISKKLDGEEMIDIIEISLNSMMIIASVGDLLRETIEYSIEYLQNLEESNCPEEITKLIKKDKEKC